MDSRSSYRNRVYPDGLGASPDNTAAGDEIERTSRGRSSCDFKSESETDCSLPITPISSEGGWTDCTGDCTDDDFSMQPTVFSNSDRSWSTTWAFSRSSPVIPFEEPSKGTLQQKSKLLRLVVFLVFFLSLSSLVITLVTTFVQNESPDCVRCLESTVHPQKAGTSQQVTGEEDNELALNSSQVIENLRALKEELRGANEVRKALEIRMAKMEAQFQVLKENCRGLGTSQSQKSSIETLWTKVNLTQKSLGSVHDLWTEVNASKKAAWNLQQKLHMLTSTIKNVSTPIRGPPGPTGSPGATGQTGLTGSGNFSLCKYDKLNSTPVTAGPKAMREIVVMEYSGFKIIGVSCDSNDAKYIMLSKGVMSGIPYYKCTCKGTHGLQKSMKCFVNNWKCPLIT